MSLRGDKWKVDVNDSVLSLRSHLDVLQREPEDVRRERQRRRAIWKVKKGDPVPEELAKWEKDASLHGIQERPEGHFDLFQDAVPKTFSGATGRPEGWSPPALSASKDGEGFWTWTGPVDRIELVKSLSRVVNVNGQSLVDEEVEYAVKMTEALESHVVKEKWEGAMRITVDLLRRFPNWSLMYWKAGIILAAWRMVEKGRGLGSKDFAPSLFEEQQTSSQSETLSVATSNFTDSSSLAKHESSDKVVSVDSVVLNQCVHFFRCAVEIEPFNRHLCGLVDFVLRLFSQLYVSKASKYRDPSLYPRSLGDAVLFAFFERPEQFIND